MTLFAEAVPRAGLLIGAPNALTIRALVSVTSTCIFGLSRRMT